MKVLVLLLSAPISRALAVAKSIGEVTVLAVSPTDQVFSSGPDWSGCEKVRVWDDCLDPSTLHPFDWEARVAAVVAQAARRLGTSVVVLTESAAGFLGAALAEQLNLAHLSEVISARVETSSDEDPQLHVRRRGMRGVQLLSGSPQAVLSVLPPIGASASSTTGESGQPVQLLSLDEISLCSGDLPPPQLQPGTKVSRRHRPRLYIGAEALVERLRRDGLE